MPGISRLTAGGDITIGNVSLNVAGMDIAAFVEALESHGVLARAGLPEPVAQVIARRFGAQKKTCLDEIADFLLDKAEEYKALLARLHALTNDDPKVSRLREAAADQISEADFAGADGLLAQAENLDLTALAELEEASERKRRSAAESRGARGDAALLNSDQLAAAAHFDAAAEILRPVDAMEAANNWDWKAATQRQDRGLRFGDRDASLTAIAGWEALMNNPALSTADRRGAKASLASTLGLLGEYEADTDRLESALTMFNELLAEPNLRYSDSGFWARTQNNFGLVLLTCNLHSPAINTLQRATSAFQAALTVFTKENDKNSWATLQRNLGTSLGTLGEITNDITLLIRSIASFEAALTVRTKEHTPADWATTQDNMGIVLHTLGQRTRDVVALKRANRAFEAALTIRERETMPMSWALTQCNVGNLAISRASLCADPELCDAAIAHFEEANAVFREKSADAYVLKTEQCIARASAARDALLADGSE